MMRLFYNDEGPIDTLLQIAAKPVWDGDLISKECRNKLVAMNWVDRCQGWNIITPTGQSAISTLKLCRTNQRVLSATEQANNLHKAFAENDIPWPAAKPEGE